MVEVEKTDSNQGYGATGMHIVGGTAKWYSYCTNLLLGCNKLPLTWLK